LLKHKTHIIHHLYNPQPLHLQQILKHYLPYPHILPPYLPHTSLLLNQYIHHHKKLLFQPTQPIILHLKQQTYPFLTSS
ncbi:adenylosuccinate synthetase, partial [Paenibacillus xylanexedens]|uniref:adenylosuccinate synthetase n=1 Tax=Paenibacillus xylanexedens TaxID=528191 RepID=UPI001642F0CB